MGDFVLVVSGTGAIESQTPRLFAEFLDKLGVDHYLRSAIYNHNDVVKVNAYNITDGRREIVNS